MTAVPGLRPRLPVMTVGPVLVTVEPPSTAKLCSTPCGGAADVEVEGGALTGPAVTSWPPPPAPHPARRTVVAVKTASGNLASHIFELLMAISSVTCTIRLPLNELRVVTAGSGLGRPFSYTPGTSPEACEPVCKIFRGKGRVCSVANMQNGDDSARASAAT